MTVTIEGTAPNEPVDDLGRAVVVGSQNRTVTARDGLGIVGQASLMSWDLSGTLGDMQWPLPILLVAASALIISFVAHRLSPEGR
ncbi:MAG: hypothetical protein ACRDRK_21365 [Pseudonocardia sp.]